MSNVKLFDLDHLNKVAKLATRLAEIQEQLLIFEDSTANAKIILVLMRASVALKSELNSHLDKIEEERKGSD